MQDFVKEMKDFQVDLMCYTIQSYNKPSGVEEAYKCRLLRSSIKYIYNGKINNIENVIQCFVQTKNYAM